MTINFKMKSAQMNTEKLFAMVRRKNAARFYNNAATLIGARQDFLYLVYGDTPEIREIYEKANQVANPLTCTHDLLKLTERYDITIEEHMKTDPETCKNALDAVVIGIEEFRIKSH